MCVFNRNKSTVGKWPALCFEKHVTEDIEARGVKVKGQTPKCLCITAKSAKHSTLWRSAGPFCSGPPFLLASPGNTNEAVISVWGSQIERWVIGPPSIPSRPAWSSAVRERITLCQSNEPLPSEVDQPPNEWHSGGSRVHQLWQACLQQPQSVTRMQTIDEGAGNFISDQCLDSSSPAFTSSSPLLSSGGDGRHTLLFLFPF